MECARGVAESCGRSWGVVGGWLEYTQQHALPGQRGIGQRRVSRCVPVGGVGGCRLWTSGRVYLTVIIMVKSDRDGMGEVDLYLT